MVQNARDLTNDPQLQYRQHYVILQHPAIGANVVDQVGFKLSRMAAQRARPRWLGSTTPMCMGLYWGSAQQRLLR